MSGEIAFRPLAREDFPLLERWRAEPHVRRWYGGPLSREALESKYGPRIDGAEPTCCFLAVWEGRPIGYIQWYRLADYPPYAKGVGAEPGSAGVDLFLGEPELLYQGWGARVLAALLAEHVFADPEIEVCLIGPVPENGAAIRCYEKAGFRHWKTVALPGEPGREYLMRLERGDFAK